MRTILCGFLLAFITLPVLAQTGDPKPSPVAAPSHPVVTIETLAKQAILIDMTTNTVLFEKNAEQRMPTSSMSKVLTMYVVFDALKKGQLKLTDTLPVSEKAWRMQGSKMFIKVGEQVKVDDLIHGVIIQSGNDACVALAEGLAGTEDAFVTRMNQKAQELGMKNSHFMNASGWPDPDHYSTARDLSTLAIHYIRTYPEYFPLHSQTSFTYNGINQENRNPLLHANIGADGLKTGHTDDGGFGLIGTTIQQGRRLLLVVNGLSSMKERAEESAKLISWGYRAFASPVLFKAGDVVTTAPVWLGQQSDVALVTPAEIRATFPRMDSAQLKVEVQYKGPIAAPIKAGEEVGKVLVTVPGAATPVAYPLTVAKDVEALSPLSRIPSALKYLLVGHS